MCDCDDTMASYYAEGETGEEVSALLQKPKAPVTRKRNGPPTWTTKDKRVIPIKDLENGHLVNIIKMLERKAKGLIALYDLQATLSIDRMFRGEMARDAAFNSLAAEVEGADLEVLYRVYPTFKHLVDEAHSRTLEPPIDIEVAHVFEAVGLS